MSVSYRAADIRGNTILVRPSYRRAQQEHAPVAWRTGIPVIHVYTIRMKLGKYGMGEVLLAQQKKSGRPHFMPCQQVVEFKNAGSEVDFRPTVATVYQMLTAAVPCDFSPNEDPWLSVLGKAAVPIR